VIRVALSGACGRMGTTVRALAAESDAIACTALIDPAMGTSFADCREEVDVAIDFSTAAALDEVLTFCVRLSVPLILATTGHDETAEERIAEAAERVAILQSANLSYGAYVLAKLAEKAKALLGGGYDIAIIEAHHRAKKDAPSGTAKLLAGAMGLKDPQTLSIRAGAMVGVHEIGFYGERDTLFLRHDALDRRLFAKGALDAAKWIVGCAPGLYGLADFMADREEKP